jgi:iron complex transport system ATP-binding protein
MTVIELRNVEFGYGDHSVLDSVSFKAEPGEFVGLVGPNGSGKTTLLKLIQGFLHPRKGSVLLDGRELRSYAQKDVALRVAGVWQRPSIAFGVTARQLVLLGRTPHMGPLKWETSHDVEIANASMRTTETMHLADRTPLQMSAGELQRVLIASALAQQTSVLLLDEPTSFLDLRQSGRLSRLLRDLHRGGMTIVCASHDLALIRRHCDKVLLLAEGTIRAEGPLTRC